MSASPEPELTGITPELVLRPIATTVRTAEDRGENPSPSKDDEEECRTPTSKESKLPSIPKSCPPAPRKPRRVWCKRRRLQELEVIAVGAEELERLFQRRNERYAMASGPRHAKKRRCHCPDDN